MVQACGGLGAISRAPDAMFVEWFKLHILKVIRDIAVELVLASQVVVRLAELD